MGVLGLGFQAWDFAYLFSDDNNYREPLEYMGQSRWEFATPAILNALPIISRMVHRQEIAPGPMYRYRAPKTEDAAPSADCKANTTQTSDWDTRTFVLPCVDNSVLAEYRFVNDIPSDKPGASDELSAEDLEPAHSDSQQIRWVTNEEKDRAYILIDTPYTKGVIGYGLPKTITIGPVKFVTSSGYNTLFVTSESLQSPLDQTQDWLVLNGTQYLNQGAVIAGGFILEHGQAPIMSMPKTNKICYLSDCQEFAEGLSRWPNEGKH